MPRTELSPGEMREGIDAMLERRFSLAEHNNSECDKAIGKLIQEKIDEGFEWGMIIFPIFAPFFLSKSRAIEEAKQQFIDDNGGEGEIEFYGVERSGEVLVLMK